MGAKTWMLIHSDGDLRDALRSGSALDPNATLALVSKLFPKQQFKYVGQGDLSYTNPPKTEVHAGCFPGFSVVAAMDYAVDYPSRLPPNLLEHARQGVAYLHAMHSVVDWFAFAIWKEGKLRRSLSLSPDSGVMEDIGDHLPFEIPFWEGEHPAIDPGDDPADYPLPFHPLDLGDAALRALFGYQLEGYIDDTLLKPENVPLMRFRRSKSLWRFWQRS